MSYVTVDDVDATTAKTDGAGGVVLTKPFDVKGVGRMSIIQDPTGGMLALWQAGTSIGAGLANEPVSLNWNELFTRDVSAAEAFYTEVIGWGARTSEMSGGGKYTEFTVDGREVAGMMAISEERSDMAPHWRIYLSVADTDATVERAKDLGGNLIAGPMDVPGVGRFALLSDPQGAAFSIIQAAVVDA